METPQGLIPIGNFVEMTPEPKTGKIRRIELRQPPTGAEIEATRDMLAEKDQNWQAPEEDDFGSMFARPAAVVCKPAAA